MRKKCIHATKPKRGPYPNARGWQGVGFKFKDEAAREKSLMRHPWYRKKKFFDALRAKQHKDRQITEQV